MYLMFFDRRLKMTLLWHCA